MESKKTFHLLALAFSLLMIQRSMASRILAENNPPPPDDDGSRIGASGSVPRMDGSWNGISSDQGMVLVPPPMTKTTMSQVGQPDMSASSVVVAPTDADETNADVDVSTTVCPTSVTAEASVTSSCSTSSTSVTSSGNAWSTTSESSFSTVSESSSATFTEFP